MMDDESLECTILLIRAWRDATDLGQQLRAALLARPAANVVILQGTGVLVLAPSLASLNRRMNIVERLLLVATGAMPPVMAPCRTGSEALGVRTHNTSFSFRHILPEDTLALHRDMGRAFQSKSTA
jgi:hypothetical protein